MCGQKGWRSSYLWTLQMSVFFDCLRLSVHFGMNFAQLSSRRLPGWRQIRRRDFSKTVLRESGCCESSSFWDGKCQRLLLFDGVSGADSTICLI